MNNDLISREVLTKELRERLAACNDWEEQAKDKETRIRANAVKAFICEMLMLLKEIPSSERPQGKWHHSGECSVCHKRSYKTTPLGDIIGLDFTDFCKNCGADMRGGVE